VCLCRTHLGEGELLGVGEVCALGQQVVPGGRALEGAQELAQVRAGGGHPTGGGPLGRVAGLRAQLLLDALVQAGQLPGAVLLVEQHTHKDVFNYCRIVY